MPEVLIVYWRDIPAQVIVGKGRQASKVQLAERFEQAIDRCAMKTEMVGTDDYLAEWRKSSMGYMDGSPDEIARKMATDIEDGFDNEKLKVLIANDGWENSD
ncbi:MAG: virulence factor [Rhodobacteraceae bacterium]|nr:virulence factor [Paracoccaceae bacterium]